MDFLGGYGFYGCFMDFLRCFGCFLRFSMDLLRWMFSKAFYVFFVFYIFLLMRLSIYGWMLYFLWVGKVECTFDFREFFR